MFLESPSSYHRRVANVSGAEPGGSIGFKTPRGIRPQNQRFQALPDSPRHPVRRRRWTCHAGVVLPCTTAEPLISCCQKSETRSNHLAIPDKPNSSRVVFEYSISRPGPGYMQAELPPRGQEDISFQPLLGAQSSPESTVRGSSLRASSRYTESVDDYPYI